MCINVYIHYPIEKNIHTEMLFLQAAVRIKSKGSKTDIRSTARGLDHLPCGVVEHKQPLRVA